MKYNEGDILKVGMTVIYRGSWGYDSPKYAVVTGIELCEQEHEKYGEQVDEVTASEVYRCCIDLNDGHWAYGYQVDKIVG